MGNRMTTLDDVWAVIKELAEENKKTGQAQQRTEQAQQRTEQAQQRTEQARQKTEQVLRELSEEHKKTEQAQQKTEQTQQKTKQAQQKTEQAQQKTEQALQELAKSQQKTEDSIRELKGSLDETNGNFNNKWGSFLENFIEGDLLKIFKQRNVEVNRLSPGHIVKSPEGQVLAEYDFILPNGEVVIVVEVKTTVSSNKLDSFIDKLRRFKGYCSEFSKHKIYGAIAYVKADRELLKNAQDHGLYLIQAPGGENNVTLLANPEDFTPKAY